MGYIVDIRLPSDSQGSADIYEGCRPLLPRRCAYGAYGNVLAMHERSTEKQLKQKQFSDVIGIE